MSAVRAAGQLPLQAIGSGGSLTAAEALAGLHQQFTGQMAIAATPLQAVELQLSQSTSHWLLSAGGRNVDILAAAKTLIASEPRQLAALCGRVDSPLGKLFSQHQYSDLLIYPPPSGKDGFLATNSLLAFVTLLARAYLVQFRGEDAWHECEAILRQVVDQKYAVDSSWEEATDVLWSRPTTLVLHSSATRIGAIDLESKFTEAALGNLQLADYRNFAHGRHHWLAKRGDSTAVLAFITDRDRDLACRTLDLLPPSVPQARLAFPGDIVANQISSLVAALRITGWAGASRGIDPGRPGVPEFGRKLYRLRPARKTVRKPRGLSVRDVASIARKAGVSTQALVESGEFEGWKSHLEAFRKRILRSRFAGIVLDYDGTVVDPRNRFEPPSHVMTMELTRLIDQGASIGIATGRGKSVRKDLQSCLTPSLWGKVQIGYYNGAVISTLDDDGEPVVNADPCEQLASLAQALRAHQELALTARQTDRPYQITLESVRSVPEGRLWDIAHQVILDTDAQGVLVSRSSHSIDINPVGVSKLSVVKRIAEISGRDKVLTVGDRGLWPGNDHELLRQPYSLGVDEVSADPASCWNLATPGQRGPDVTLEYLRSLHVVDGDLCFVSGALK